MKIYDSLNTGILCDDYEKYLIRIHGHYFDENKLVKFPTIRSQTDATSCGYFTIMSFISILFGINPEDIRMKKSQLLSHVLRIFDTRILEPFPSIFKSVLNHHFLNRNDNPYFQAESSRTLSHFSISGRVENHANRRKSSFTFKHSFTSILKPSNKNIDIHTVNTTRPEDSLMFPNKSNLQIFYNNVDDNKSKKILNPEKCFDVNIVQDFSGHSVPKTLRKNTFSFKQPFSKRSIESEPAYSHPFITTMQSDDYMKKILNRILPLVYEVVPEPTIIESPTETLSVKQFVNRPVLQTEKKKNKF